MDVEIKGTKKKVAKKNTKGKVVREEKEDEKEVQLSKVEAKRSKPSPYLKAQIKKMTKEQKETAIRFMEKRNEARLAANMEPAYSQSDMDLYN